MKVGGADISIDLKLKKVNNHLTADMYINMDGNADEID